MRGCNMLQMIWDMRHELTNTFFLSCPSESSSTSMSCPSGPAHVTLPRWMYRRANRLAVLLRFVMCAARVNFFFLFILFSSALWEKTWFANASLSTRGCVIMTSDARAMRIESPRKSHSQWLTARAEHITVRALNGALWSLLLLVIGNRYQSNKHNHNWHHSD